jgi:hypothetical protein
VTDRIDERTARGLARHQVATLAVDSGLELVLQPELTAETDVGWVFFYESRRYLETGDERERLMGNAPLLVCHTGAVHLLGTERPVEAYLDDFRRSGDPYGGIATELGG